MDSEANFFDRRFPFPRVADAAGIMHATAAKWINRGFLVVRPEDREETGRGGRKMLSAGTTLQTILAVELNRLGMRPEDACEAAIKFAHWSDIKGEVGAKYDRPAGHLFPGRLTDVLTLFIPNRVDAQLSKVERIEANVPIGKIRSCLDAVDLEMLFYFRLGGLGVDVHRAIADMKGVA